MPSVYLMLHLTDRTKEKPVVTIRRPEDMVQHTETPLVWMFFTALSPLGPRTMVQVDVGLHIQDKDCLAADSRGLFWSKEEAEKAALKSIEETVVKKMRNWEEVNFLWSWREVEKGVGALGRISGAADGGREWWEVVEVDVAV